MSQGPGNDDKELRRLRSAVAAQQRDIHDLDDREHRQETLIARLREEAALREGDLAVLGERLEAAEHELEDLRAIRDALTPLPQRPGLELAAVFLPAAAEQVSGDFYLVAEGPEPSLLVAHADASRESKSRQLGPRALSHNPRVSTKRPRCSTTPVSRAGTAAGKN